MTKRLARISHEFVEYIPDRLEAGRIYISIPFATAVHRCCCGCGREVVTPLSPTDWEISFNGETVSLDPSIGNWNYPCQSHYWITHNRVIWAARLTRSQIQAARAKDRAVKDAHLAASERPEPVDEDGRPRSRGWRSSLWSRLKSLFS